MSLITRLSTHPHPHRIVVIFLVVAFLHATIVGLLQGAAVETSRHGSGVLSAIQKTSHLNGGGGNATEQGVGGYAQMEMVPSLTNTVVITSSPVTRVVQASGSSTSSSSPKLAASIINLTTSSSRTTTLPTTTTSSSPSSTKSPSSTPRKGSEHNHSKIAFFPSRKNKDDDDDDDKKNKSRKRGTLVASSPNGDGVVATVTNGQGETFAVTQECAVALKLPTVQIQRLETMSLTFIFYHVWLLLLTFAGVYLQSAPHVFAALLAHFLAFIYAIVQIVLTNSFHNAFHDTLVQNSCGSASFLPQFWKETMQFEIAIVVLEAVGTLALSCIAVKLSSVFEWQTFKKIGADRRVAKAHVVALVFEIFVHISAFFVTAFQGIWLHELTTYPWPPSFYLNWAELSKGYEVFLGVMTGLVVPWLVVGWLAFKRDSKWLMASFLLGDVLFLGHTLFLATQKIYMDTSTSFRFLTFLGAVAAISAAGTLVLGMWKMFTVPKPAPSNLDVTWITPFPKDSADFDLEKGLTRTLSARKPVPLEHSATLVITKAPPSKPGMSELQRNTSARSLQPSVKRKAPPVNIHVEPLKAGRLGVVAFTDEDERRSETISLPPGAKAQRGSKGTFGAGGNDSSRWSSSTKTSEAPEMRRASVQPMAKKGDTSRWSFSTVTTQTESSVGFQTPGGSKGSKAGSVATFGGPARGRRT